MISNLGMVFLFASALFFCFALHPFVSYPLSLAALARLRPRPVATGAAPRGAAICVSAYNEERVIRAKVENILGLREAYPGLEILVYVDAASDRTAEILREYEGQLRVVVSSARLGKTHGMNTLVGLTRAECLVFTDANVMFAPDAIPRLLAPFADPAVGAVCGHLVYGDGGGATAETGSLYWRLEEKIKRLESASGSVMGADGSIFAIRRCLHRPPPADLIDDMYASLMILCEGARIVRADDALAYEESVARPAEEFRRKVRIACQAWNVHRALWPRLRRLPLLDRYKYISHKLLRWLTIYLLGCGFVSLLLGLTLLRAWVPLACLVGVAAASVVAMATFERGPPMKARLILEAFAATGLGVWRSFRGERFQTWNPPASARAISGGAAP